MRKIPFALTFLLPFAAQAASPIAPGMWVTTSSVTSMDMPGMPANVLAMMKQPHTIKHCVTAEEAARGPQEMLKADKSCKLVNYSMTGGAFDVQMQCSGPTGTRTIHSRGTFTPTSYSGTSSIVATGEGAMKMTASATGKLIGPCTH